MPRTMTVLTLCGADPHSPPAVNSAVILGSGWILPMHMHTYTHARIHTCTHATCTHAHMHMHTYSRAHAMYPWLNRRGQNRTAPQSFDQVRVRVRVIGLG